MGQKFNDLNQVEFTFVVEHFERIPVMWPSYYQINFGKQTKNEGGGIQEVGVRLTYIGRKLHSQVGNLFLGGFQLPSQLADLL